MLPCVLLGVALLQPALPDVDEAPPDAPATPLPPPISEPEADPTPEPEPPTHSVEGDETVESPPIQGPDGPSDDDDDGAVGMPAPVPPTTPPPTQSPRGTAPTQRPSGGAGGGGSPSTGRTGSGGGGGRSGAGGGGGQGGGGAGGGGPSGSGVTSPSGASGGGGGGARPPAPRPTGRPEPPGGGDAGDAEAPETQDDEAEAEAEDGEIPRWRKLKFVRIGFWPKIGYTSGTSDRNGVFDREKTIESVMMGGTGPVAGDDKTVKFGGFMYGGEIDLEVFLINVWLDFQKFFTPGGSISAMVGYDHEFWLHRVVRLDAGLGFGFMRIFLGGPLENLYFDKQNPESINIATAGIEGRAMVNLGFRIWGPLYTGPAGMLGYHYLFTANASEVTKEKGLHFGGAWIFKVEFAFPRDKVREKGAPRDH